MTVSASFALSSPSPRRRTPSLARRTMPAATSAATSTGLPASRRLSSIACCSAPTLISLKSLRSPLVEAALGQAAMQRHLAAFEAADRDAGAGRLALAAAAALLADAGADAAADAHAQLARAGLVFDFVEPHRTASSLGFLRRRRSTMRTRWRNLVDHAAHGRSIFERRACGRSLLRPRPISVLVWIAGRRLALRDLLDVRHAVFLAAMSLQLLAKRQSARRSRLGGRPRRRPSRHGGATRSRSPSCCGGPRPRAGFPGALRASNVARTTL